MKNDLKKREIDPKLNGKKALTTQNVYIFCPFSNIELFSFVVFLSKLVKPNFF